jgi:hypothetical protein
MKKIRITLHKDGTSKVEVLGAVGDECLGHSAELEKRLGTPIGDRVLKPEFYEAETVREGEREVER